jgi:predicted ribosomally synthesized peptide with nif11-like leader
MFNKTALSFIDKLNEDSDLQKRLIGADVNTLVKVAGEKGYSFSANQWQETINSLYAAELSDEELGQVAGGAGTQKPPAQINLKCFPQPCCWCDQINPAVINQSIFQAQGG